MGVEREQYDLTQSGLMREDGVKKVTKEVALESIQRALAGYWSLEYYVNVTINMSDGRVLTFIDKKRIRGKQYGTKPNPAQSTVGRRNGTKPTAKPGRGGRKSK